MEPFILQIFQAKEPASEQRAGTPPPEVQESRAGCWSWGWCPEAGGWGLRMHSAVLRATPQV